MKYLIKDTQNNKLYRPNLINTIVEGEEIGEYIKTINNDMFLLSEVEAVTMEIINHSRIREGSDRSAALKDLINLLSL